MACCASKSKSTVIENGALVGPITKLESSMRNKHIIRIFEERIKTGKIPDKKTAVHFGDNAVLTYAQLNTFASCLAKNIIDRLGYEYKLNSNNDLVIAVCLPMSEKTIALILGVLKTGAAYLPLDPKHPEELLLKIVSTFKPSLLITDDNGSIYNKYDVEEFNNICRVISIEELWLDIEFTLEPKTRRPSMEVPWMIDFIENSATAGEHPVIIMYCQGMDCDNSVGVRIGTESILNMIQFHWNKFKLSEKDVSCVTVSISSPIFITQFFFPLMLGCTLHLFRRQDLYDMDSFLKNIVWRKVTTLSLPTHHLKPFLDSVGFQKDSKLKTIKSLRCVMCRGSVIPFSLAKTFFEIFKTGVILANCCGFIQTTGAIIFEIYDSWKDYQSKIVSGKATFSTIVDNVKVYILDKEMNVAPEGTKGEICVSGKCLAMGYVGEGPKGGTGQDHQFIKNPFPEQNQLYERLYKTGECATIVKGNRIALDDRHDLLATQTYDDNDIIVQRKW